MRIGVPDEIVDAAVPFWLGALLEARVVDAMRDAHHRDIGARLEQLSHAIEVEAARETPVVLHVQKTYGASSVA